MLPTGYLCNNGELCIICYVHVYFNFYICRNCLLSSVINDSHILETISNEIANISGVTLLPSSVYTQYTHNSIYKSIQTHAHTSAAGF